MTFEEALKALKEGKKVRKKNVGHWMVCEVIGRTHCQQEWWL